MLSLSLAAAAGVSGQLFLLIKLLISLYMIIFFIQCAPFVIQWSEYKLTLIVSICNQWFEG